MKSEIYLDNNATTKPDPTVIEALLPCLKTHYGNASSVHKKGIEAERALRESRRTVARALGANENEIIFTSGATESDNLAITGIARAYTRRGNHIITTKVEHPAVLEPCRALENDGFTIDYLDVTKDGIDIEKLKNLITDKTILISIMHVNNETGQISPIEKLAEQIKKTHPYVIFHSDGTQAFGKIPIDLTHIDLYSISGHKIHGPKGVGALYIKTDVQEKDVSGTHVTVEQKPIIIEPIIRGGGQERDLRGGTENIPAIVGFAKAAEIAHENLETTQTHFQKLKEVFLNEIKEIPNFTINSPEGSIPSTINLSIPPIPGEVIVNALSEKEIYISTGAACASRKGKKNYVLEAMGYPKEIIDASIRISFSRHTTEEEINTTTKTLKEIVTHLT